MLATYARFAARFAAHAAAQTAIEALILEVSRVMAQASGRAWGGRPCLEKDRRVHHFSVPRGDQATLRLPARPVLAVHEAVEAVLGDYDDAEALADGDDFHWTPGGGELHRIGYWMQGDRGVRVDYTAGYTGPDTFDASEWMPDAWEDGAEYEITDRVLFDGAVYAAADAIEASTSPPPADPDNWTLSDVLAPDDLIKACLVQAGHDWQRRANLGVAGEGVQGMSVSWATKIELLPGVREICRAYQRL